MIGPIVAIILFVAAGLGLSAWSILRRASEGKADDRVSEEENSDVHFAVGVEVQANSSTQGPA
jgi:hypothetical protein